MKASPLKPLKRFGQNFLIDPNIRRKIMASIGTASDDEVLEIGPGYGSLTLELVKSARRVIAVEIDRGLCAHLKSVTENIPNIRLVCADILKFDLKRFLRQEGAGRVRVVSNLPYYITTPVLEYLFDRIDLIEDIHITIQKEVGERMTALAGESPYGSLSCFVDYFCEARVLFGVPAGVFRPQPEVASVFMRLKPRLKRRSYWGVRSEDLLFRVIRTGFGQRRKKLRSSLAAILKPLLAGHGEPEPLLERRPEEVSLAEYVLLSNRIFDFLKHE
ncbi:MAG: 16S rRNA (adenine(1518)-N(6)/adenine(1519)-N(6))-dimethyltransferase RsmA [Candidatus Omnitrophica bacterium]|nr:16S rRNA (adenine(1518)-N(6)/adenine(1519)-N(6))-dimethyltransferase RsmA [Candidatus Omnitrophota bacterium]MDD5573950.1 16S rRNA (adenine(1518)-N(6)/adenine(1519)-N(6))-dimethyltransferase RsmA [Candidatus Omnitrophota bacterium]